jgi:hypothetical protein
MSFSYEWKSPKVDCALKSNKGVCARGRSLNENFSLSGGSCVNEILICREILSKKREKRKEIKAWIAEAAQKVRAHYLEPQLSLFIISLFEAFQSGAK